MIQFNKPEIEVLSETVSATIDVGQYENWGEYLYKLERRGYTVTQEEGTIWTVKKTQY